MITRRPREYSGSSQTNRRLWNIRVKAGDVQWEDKSDNTCLSQSYTIALTVSAFLEADLETTPLTRDLLSRLSNQIPKSYMYSWRKTGGGREKYSAFRNQSLFPPQALWWYSILKHLAGALCFFSILPAYRGCITGPVQTESCNYPECHLIAAPLSAASPRASPLYIGHTERERERAGRNDSIMSWNQLKLHNVSHPSYHLITMPGFLHTLLLFCRSRCDVWHKTESIRCPLHAACFIRCQSSDCRKWRVLWCYSSLSWNAGLCLSVPSI